MPNLRLLAALFLAVLLLGSVGVALFYSGENEATEALRPPTPALQEPLVSADLRPYLQRLTIEHTPSGRVAQFIWEDAHWQQTLPQTQPADDDRFVNPLNFLLSQPSRRTLTPVPTADLAQYGLDQPRFILDLQFHPPEAQPITHTLQVGNPTPTDDGFYVRLNDENQVHLIYQTGLLELLLWVRE